MDFIQNYWMIWLAIGAVLYIVSCISNGTLDAASEIFNVFIYLIIWPVMLLIWVAKVMRYHFG